MIKSQAVIGCCFGDEGKGKVVSYLCSQSEIKRPLVIRYCGGHQAGHHVVIDDKCDHVFSNFGSGTLQGVDTYWSEYCTVDPVGIINELIELKSKLISPYLYINENCPITTPYEKIANVKADKLSGHGSVGVGVGQTFQREEDHYSLTVSDLFHPKVLRIKLELLRKYYHIENIDYNNIYEESIYNFKRSCEKIIDSYYIKITNAINVKMYDNFIFEGGQGLLLDQNFGFFPHVTRSNTGTKNILKMGFSPEIFLVTRAYLTRHGNGPLTNENIHHSIKDNP